MTTTPTHPIQEPTAEPDTYRQLITVGLYADVLATFKRHGFSRCDNDPVRLARALEATCCLADTLAGKRSTRAS